MIFRTRKIIMPSHLNGAGTLFGGQALAWIDEEAAIYAACQTKSTKLVTKAISAIEFLAPAHVGDFVEIGTELVRFGRTSITVSCTIRNKTTGQTIVKVDAIVFVTLDADGKPTPHGITAQSE
jgi:acyl-CoA thioesterase YciA